MNNAEEILNNLEWTKERAMGFPQVKKETAIKAMQAHTNQTLQEMKEKVGKEDGFIDPQSEVEVLAKDHVLQLIDEAINE